jgi:PTS system nitrogen regulatory IIA component
MQLTTADVARLFGVSAATVAHWVQDENLPASEVDSQYRFNREELVEWATLHKLAIPAAILQPATVGQAAEPSLADALAFGGVAYGVAGADRSALLQAALQGLPLPDEDDREALLSLFLARERLGTTAVGDGVAIPHPRCPLVLGLPQSAVRLCFLAQAHDFGAADGKPVDTLFLMVSRTVHEHLKLLARLATALRCETFRQVLARRPPTEEIIAALRREESVR